MKRDQTNMKWPEGLRDKVYRAAKRAGESGSLYTQKAVLGRMLMDDWDCPTSEYPTRGHKAVIPDPVALWRVGP